MEVVVASTAMDKCTKGSGSMAECTEKVSSFDKMGHLTLVSGTIICNTVTDTKNG